MPIPRMEARGPLTANPLREPGRDLRLEEWIAGGEKLGAVIHEPFCSIGQLHATGSGTATHALALFDDHNLEPLGCKLTRGRKATQPCSDDGYVVDHDGDPTNCRNVRLIRGVVTFLVLGIV